MVPDKDKITKDTPPVLTAEDFQDPAKPHRDNPIKQMEDGGEPGNALESGIKKQIWPPSNHDGVST